MCVHACVCARMWGLTWGRSGHSCYRKAGEELDSFHLDSGSQSGTLALKLCPSRVS